MSVYIIYSPGFCISVFVKKNIFSIRRRCTYYNVVSCSVYNLSFGTFTAHVSSIKSVSGFTGILLIFFSVGAYSVAYEFRYIYETYSKATLLISLSFRESFRFGFRYERSCDSYLCLSLIIYSQFRTCNVINILREVDVWSRLTQFCFIFLFG